MYLNFTIDFEYEISIENWGQAWRSGTECYCKGEWLWMKYLFKFIFPFLRSGVNKYPALSSTTASRIRRKVGNILSED